MRTGCGEEGEVCEETKQNREHGQGGQSGKAMSIRQSLGFALKVRGSWTRAPVQQTTLMGPGRVQGRNQRGRR